MRALIAVIGVVIVILLMVVALNSGKTDAEKARTAYKKCVSRVAKTYGSDQYRVGSAGFDARTKCERHLR